MGAPGGLATNASALSKKLDPMFEDIADCESRSFWQVQDVK